MENKAILNGLIESTDISKGEELKIHAQQRKSKQIHQLWFEIQDVVGPAREWPTLIRTLFWTKVKHDMRPIISAFVVVNGLNPQVFMQWARLIKICRDEAGYKELQSWLNTFNSEPHRWKRYYGFNVLGHRYEHVDGSVRTYKKKSDRK